MEIQMLYKNFYNHGYKKISPEGNYVPFQKDETLLIHHLKESSLFFVKKLYWDVLLNKMAIMSAVNATSVTHMRRYSSEEKFYEDFFEDFHQIPLTKKLTEKTFQTYVQNLNLNQRTASGHIDFTINNNENSTNCHALDSMGKIIFSLRYPCTIEEVLIKLIEFNLLIMDKEIYKITLLDESSEVISLDGDGSNESKRKNVERISKSGFFTIDTNKKYFPPSQIKEIIF